MVIVGRTLVANQRLAGSACGKRRRAWPLNSVVRLLRISTTIHLGPASRSVIASTPIASAVPHLLLLAPRFIAVRMAVTATRAGGALSSHFRQNPAHETAIKRRAI